MRTNYLSPWRVFDPFESIFSEADQSGVTGAAAFSPSHVEESEKHYLIEMDAPGVLKEDIKLRLENNQLIIEGERKGRMASKFRKAYYLPDDADAERVEAEHKNGVLSITVAKAEKRSGKLIPILGSEK